MMVSSVWTFRLRFMSATFDVIFLPSNLLVSLFGILRKTSQMSCHHSLSPLPYFCFTLWPGFHSCHSKNTAFDQCHRGPTWYWISLRYSVTHHSLHDRLLSWFLRNHTHSWIFSFLFPSASQLSLLVFPSLLDLWILKTPALASFLFPIYSLSLYVLFPRFMICLILETFNEKDNGTYSWF